MIHCHCGAKPNAEMQGRDHEGPIIRLSHCQWGLNIESKWHTSDKVDKSYYIYFGKTGCKEYAIQYGKDFLRLRLYRDHQPPSAESIEFCNNNMYQTSVYVENDKLLMEMAHNRIIDGYNAMFYRAAIFYDCFSQYQEVDIDKFCHDIEMIEKGKQGLDLYLSNKDDTSDKHLRRVKGCTGPIDYYDWMGIG